MNLNDEFTRNRLERRPKGARLLVLSDHDKRNVIGPQLRAELLEAIQLLGRTLMVAAWSWRERAPASVRVRIWPRFSRVMI